jgi:Kef-type K+ transport system membrane component KefB
LRERNLSGFDPKLSALAFGLSIPFFFTVSGMSPGISAFASAGAGGIPRTVLFFC